jgi:uncharacterized protein YdiU (UPF0061 family)
MTWLWRRTSSRASQRTRWTIHSSSADSASADGQVAALFARPGVFHDWAVRWRGRLAEEDVAPAERANAMRCVNPAFIPRNHRIEELIVAAVARSDFEPFETMLRVLERPYDDQPNLAYLSEAPRPEERVRETFCGT